MFPRYLQYLLTDFRQTFVTGASQDRDELIRFWGQKVKGQGHSMTKYIPDFYLSAISPVSVDGFSPNFCHWCILGHRWPDYVFGSKGQSSRSHHRGWGALHSTLPSSATFSSWTRYVLSVEWRTEGMLNDEICENEWINQSIKSSICKALLKQSSQRRLPMSRLAQRAKS